MNPSFKLKPIIDAIRKLFPAKVEESKQQPKTATKKRKTTKC